MNKPLEEQFCKNCRYYPPGKDECRRNAPQPSIDRSAAAWWPVVSAHDWCGEWVQR